VISVQDKCNTAVNLWSRLVLLASLSQFALFHLILLAFSVMLDC
jgi:hypothetical protein